MQMVKAERLSGIAHLWLAAARRQVLRRSDCVRWLVQQGATDTQTLDWRVRRYGRVGQDTEVNKIGLMHSACWIHTLRICNNYCFSTATVIM